MSGQIGHRYLKTSFLHVKLKSFWAGPRHEAQVSHKTKQHVIIPHSIPPYSRMNRQSLTHTHSLIHPPLKENVGKDIKMTIPISQNQTAVTWSSNIQAKNIYSNSSYLSIFQQHWLPKSLLKNVDSWRPLQAFIKDHSRHSSKYPAEGHSLLAHVRCIFVQLMSLMKKVRQERNEIAESMNRDFDLKNK